MSISECAYAAAAQAKVALVSEGNPAPSSKQVFEYARELVREHEQKENIRFYERMREYRESLDADDH